MQMRLLFAVPDDGSLDLMHATLDSALCLTPLEIRVAETSDHAELLARVEAYLDDIVILDWQLAGPDTPRLVHDLLQQNPRLRVVALLPEHQRQYRQQVWDAGACNGIPKEHIDQEWLSTVLCIMYRAMQRESTLLANPTQG